jgi:transcriptional regulator with XRE-family HTH domain
MAEPLTPLLKWLCEEQADIQGKDLAEITGISPQTLSRMRQGKQDLSSDFLWKCMKAIARLRPRSECASFVSAIDSEKYRFEKTIAKSEPPLLRIEQALEELKDETEENQAMFLLMRRLRKSQCFR